MRELILGTAGHIDHGKTALVRALTGTDTDRLPEEKRRGITIDIGFAELALSDAVHIGIIDVPGHESFIRNMLAGATGIDLGLLVVAADEGVMPQTREHLAILELLGVRDLVVALTKADLAEPEWLELVADDVAQLLAGGPYSGAEPVPVSAKTGQGIDELRLALGRHASTLEARSADDLFRLPIDRVFSVRGTGTVVTGTLWSGSVSRDRSVRVLPAGRRARVRAIQTHGRERDIAVAGQRTALALTGVDRDDLSRGDVLVDADGWDAGPIITARLSVMRDVSPVRRGQRVRFHLATLEVPGRIVPYGGRSIDPGGEDLVQLRLEEPVVARAGDRFVIRSWSPIGTIGGGRIIEPAARRRKRIGPQTTERLAAILDGTPEEAVAAAVGLAGWKGLPTARLPVRTQLTQPETDTVIARTADRVILIGATLYHRDRVHEAGQRIVEALREFHTANPLAPGLSREHLRQVVPAPDSALADHALQELSEAGRLLGEGNLTRLADHSPELNADQREACDRIMTEFEQAGLAAPGIGDLPEEIARRPDLDDLLHHLARAGQLTLLAPGRYAASNACVHASARVRGQLAGRSDLGPADFRDIFGVSRKYLMPLLAWLDRTGVTVRNGEVRSVPRPHATPETTGLDRVNTKS